MPSMHALDSHRHPTALVYPYISFKALEYLSSCFPNCSTVLVISPPHTIDLQYLPHRCSIHLVICLFPVHQCSLEFLLVSQLIRRTPIWQSFITVLTPSFFHLLSSTMVNSNNTKRKATLWCSGITSVMLQFTTCSLTVCL